MSTIKSSSEDLTLNADGSNEVKFQINAVEKASINSSGLFTSTTIDATALTGNLPAISGASLTSLPSHSGNVAFPATQVASADANTLDDYEEGTWTPVFQDAQGTPNVSSTSLTGSYTKVGRIVYYAFALPNVDTTGLTAGDRIIIEGFPFTSDNSGGVDRHLGVFQSNNVGYASGAYLSLAIGANSTQAIIRESVTGSSSWVIVSDWTDGTDDAYCSGAYMANA
jgi:hypothetical protein